MSDQFAEIRDHFLAALERDGLEAQLRYAAEHCADIPGLHEKLVEMLRAHHQPEGFLASNVEPTHTGPITEKAGDVIGPYKLLQQIGEGGFGVVFMAEQTAPVKRKVALKVIKPGMDTRQVIARFEAERQALALMDHPNIAKVLDAGATETGRPFFVMELVRGVPITSYCDEHQLSPRERLMLFLDVCHAVQHAHQKGIIHRDIKPTNVLVTQHDDKPVVKVIDFGVAKATSVQLTDKTLFTGFAQLVGTPLYMSPEQAALSAIDIDTRSDIYSLGVLLYELLTGTTPFDKTRLQQAAFDEIRRIIREEEPAKPSTRLNDLGRSGLPSRTAGALSAPSQTGPGRQAGPTSLASIAAQRHTEPRKLSQLMRGDLDWIVMKALEKDRTRRYETANGFAADLLRYLADEPVSACPPTIGYRLRKSARRNKVALATSGVVALALLAGTVVSTWQAIRARQAEQDATTQRNIAQAQRQFARQAVDKMFTQVAEKWLSRNTSLEPVQKQILLDALQIYEELAREEGADPALRLERGNAYRRIGEINFKLGKLPESEQAFWKAQEILGSLVDQQASEPDYRSALASAWHQYGLVLHYSARMEDALDAYRQALLHRERLAADHSGIPRYTREMAVSLGGVANMLDSLGSFPEAEAAYLRAIQLMESLPREVADEPDCRYELGLLCSELSGAQDAQGRGRESLPLFYRGKAVYEQLVTEFPRDPTYREELAWALRQEATRLADQPDDAEKLYRRSLAISLQLAQESPTVPAHQSGISQRYYDLGNLLARSGRRAEAEDAFRQAARIVEQMLSDYPDWSPSDFGGSFAGCHTALQTLLLEDGRPQDAEAIYVRALDVYPRLSRRWMKSPSNRWLLAEYRWGLAKLACRYDRREDAARFSGEALLLYEQAAAELPRRLAYQQVLAARKAELGNVSTCAQPAKETGQ